MTNDTCKYGHVGQWYYKYDNWLGYTVRGGCKRCEQMAHAFAAKERREYLAGR